MFLHVISLRDFVTLPERVWNNRLCGCQEEVLQEIALNPFEKTWKDFLVNPKIYLLFVTWNISFVALPKYNKYILVYF